MIRCSFRSIRKLLTVKKLNEIEQQIERTINMYNDKSIVLPDNLPVGLQNDFAELQGYYDEGDWLQFDLLFEAVEASVKAYYLAGKISREELNLIFRKYGIA